MAANRRRLVYLIVLILINVFPTNAERRRVNKKEILKPVMAFPSESDSTLLIFPTGLQIDEQDYIYVIDQNMNAIIKYSLEGKVVREIGRRGQGPGEFGMPHEFVYDKNKIFVVDQGNRRVQILNSSGEYLSSFKLFRLIINIAHFNDTIVGQQLYDRYEFDKFKLITMYDHNGSIKGSFGDPINNIIGISGLPPVASDVKLRIYNDHIFAMYQYFPLLQVFSFDGKLIKTYKFNDKVYRNLVPGNYEIKRILAQPDYTDLRFLFLAFDVSDNGIFLCLYKDDIEIHHFDFDGKLRNIYFYKHKGDNTYYVQDFKVLCQDSLYKFLILTYLPLPRVEVFNSNKLN
jgi:hypothetical protein